MATGEPVSGGKQGWFLTVVNVHPGLIKFHEFMIWEGAILYLKRNQLANLEDTSPINQRLRFINPGLALIIVEKMVK